MNKLPKLQLRARLIPGECYLPDHLIGRLIANNNKKYTMLHPISSLNEIFNEPNVAIIDSHELTDIKD
ncbi:MAG TPA: hypothetical protein VI790_04640 [Candidatus Nanoarchaeia archaeon]|nr:hypothetical protein [Candidatus Nanoarchaeia archaeon]